MKALQITDKIIDCQETAKRFFGDEYEKEIYPYKELIKVVMKANNIKEIPALLKISKTNVYNDSPTAQVLFIAATAELIEKKK